VIERDEQVLVPFFSRILKQGAESFAACKLGAFIRAIWPRDIESSPPTLDAAGKAPG
jgi:hypothetical protein